MIKKENSRGIYYDFYIEAECGTHALKIGPHEVLSRPIPSQVGKVFLKTTCYTEDKGAGAIVFMNKLELANLISTLQVLHDEMQDVNYHNL